MSAVSDTPFLDRLERDLGPTLGPKVVRVLTSVANETFSPVQVYKRLITEVLETFERDTLELAAKGITPQDIRDAVYQDALGSELTTLDVGMDLFPTLRLLKALEDHQENCTVALLSLPNYQCALQIDPVRANTILPERLGYLLTITGRTEQTHNFFAPSFNTPGFTPEMLLTEAMKKHPHLAGHPSYRILYTGTTLGVWEFSLKTGGA